ncbi:serologically defined colon cancer antigen 8 homolog isoform X4 [Cynoglossus semilaevis]|nr:serologically defined colon cancer antigen 8 isoform X4 [Cynoglossus semilaevis]
MLEVGDSDDGRFFPIMSDEEKQAWSQKKGSEAVNQLKSLLLRQCRDIPASLSPSQKQSSYKRLCEDQKSTFPVYQDLVPMIHNQSEYIQHLEAEVKLCKEELQEMKQRVRVVVVQNETLQSELQSKYVDESLNDYTIQNSTVNKSHGGQNLSLSMKGQSLQQKTGQTLRNELEQLKQIHQAQVQSLESQIISLRKDLSVSQKECEELKILLRRKEKQAADALRADGLPRVAGLCIKCAQHEAVLAETHTNQHVQTIDRLTKERDELLVALCALRASQQEAQQREWSSCLQVKQAVVMAEEAQLEKAKVAVQCEQLSRELARQREQLERDAQIWQAKMAEAKEEGRAEVRKQKEELADTVSSLSQHAADVQAQLDRAYRDRTSLTNQLEDSLRKLTNQEHDNTQMCVELRHHVSQAQLRKDEAERELRETKTKTSRQMEKAAQEVERLSLELVGCRRHLEAAQKDGSQWQAEVLSLAEQLANAQRQLHLTRQDRDYADRAHQDELESTQLSAQEMERKLMVLLEQMESQHQQRVGEMDALLTSQNSLIKRLKEECCELLTRVEEVTEKKQDGGRTPQEDSQQSESSLQQHGETVCPPRSHAPAHEGQVQRTHTHTHTHTHSVHLTISGKQFTVFVPE